MLLLGLIWMALTHVRNIEIFAFLAPLVVAKPFAKQSNPGGAAILPGEARLNPYITLVAALTIAAGGG